MKSETHRHVGVFVAVFLGVALSATTTVRAQISQLTAVPNRTPAIGEEYTYLSSGLFEYSKTDLSLPGPMPINITRVYRSSDKTSGTNNNRAFGLGTRLNYDVFLHQVSSNEIDVEMPDSAALVCIGSGTYPYTCNTAPSGPWFNSYIDSNSDLVR
jgi:hypothetical protein